MPRRRTPRLLRLALLVLVTYLTLCALIGAWVGDAALHVPRRAIDASATRAAEGVAERQHARMEAVAMQAADGALLRAWLFTPRDGEGTGDAVLLTHGIVDTRVGMLGIAEMLLSAGYIVLSPDARAHGESGGAITTFGLLERRDLQQWVQWLHARPGARGCVHGVAVSLGAAQLLQALDPPAGFCSAVVESPFASFREVAFDRVGQHIGADPWLARTLLRPVVEFGIAITRIRYGIDLGAASPLDAVQSTHTPVLLIQGDADANIPPRHARLLKAANPAAVTLWMIGSGAHASLSAVAADAYRERLLLFLAAHDGRQATGL